MEQSNLLPMGAVNPFAQWSDMRSSPMHQDRIHIAVASMRCVDCGLPLAPLDKGAECATRKRWPLCERCVHGSILLERDSRALLRIRGGTRKNAAPSRLLDICGNRSTDELCDRDARTVHAAITQRHQPGIETRRFPPSSRPRRMSAQMLCHKPALARARWKTVFRAFREQVAPDCSSKRIIIAQICGCTTCRAASDAGHLGGTPQCRPNRPTRRPSLS